MFKIILPKLNLRVERWKYNKEFRMYVSTLGNFKDEHKKNVPIKISNQTGYCVVYTPYGIKQAHRLVMLTYKPIPNAESLTVDHLNHNKRDNSLLNLEWVTREENVIRAKNDLFVVPNAKQEQRESAEIIAGIWRFENIEAAAQYISEMYSGNIDRIRRKIKMALNQGTVYCGQVWKYNNK